MMVKVEMLEVVCDENEPVWSSWTTDVCSREEADKVIEEYRSQSDKYGKFNKVPVIFESRIIAVIPVQPEGE